jgi:hypothetical protein
MEIWLYIDDSEHGPYSVDQVQQFLDSGDITLDHFAWFDGCQEYVTVASIPDMRRKNFGTNATISKFNEYLKCAIPEGYPIEECRSLMIDLIKKGLDHNNVNHSTERCKELIFTQRQLIEHSESYMNAPWIILICILKHIDILNYYNLNSAVFSDLSDKEYYEYVQGMCDSLQRKSISLLDDEQVQVCNRLISLQMGHTLFVKISNVVNRAIKMGIKSFARKAVAPIMPNGGLITLVTGIFVIFTGSYAYVQQTIFAWLACAGCIIPFIICFIIGINKFELYKKELDKFQVIKELRTKFYKLINSLEVHNKEISLEINNHASALKQCRTYINDLIEEKKSIESEYIDPYISSE